MILRVWHLTLLGGLLGLGGCMVQEPVGYYQPAPLYYSQRPNNAPPRPGAPLVLAPSSLPDENTAPLPPPVAMEPLQPPPGSNGQENNFVAHPPPDDMAIGAPPPDSAVPADLPPAPDIAAPNLPNLVSPGSGDANLGAPPPVLGATDPTVPPPPSVLTPDPSGPSIEQQLAAIKQNLARDSSATPAPAAGAPPPAHEHYGGLSSAGDVAQP